MATKSEVQSITRPQWRGHQSAPVVGASMVINVTSDRSEASLKARMDAIRYFVIVGEEASPSQLEEWLEKNP